jgi:hypothetical protein
MLFNGRNKLHGFGEGSFKNDWWLDLFGIGLGELPGNNDRSIAEFFADRGKKFIKIEV